MTAPTPIRRIAPPPPDTPAGRLARLQAEARALAREHVALLIVSLTEAVGLAASVEGSAYPPGAPDLCRRLADDLAAKAKTLSAIVGRA